MTDEELIARLQSACYLALDDGTNDYGTAPAVADRIEALVKERDRQYDENVHRIAEQAKAEARADLAKAVNARLKAQVKAAFREGFLAGKEDGWVNNPWIESEWRQSRARALLAEIEGAEK